VDIILVKSWVLHVVKSYVPLNNNILESNFDKWNMSISPHSHASNSLPKHQRNLALLCFFHPPPSKRPCMENVIEKLKRSTTAGAGGYAYGSAFAYAFSSVGSTD
jgi:hypothetical protein